MPSQECTPEEYAALVRSTWTEKQFLHAVIVHARMRGWKTLHIRPGLTQGGRWVTAIQGDGIGWPDFFACRGQEMVAWELKIGKNKFTPAQSEWLSALAAVGAKVGVRYPRDWEEIVEVLR